MSVGEQETKETSAQDQGLLKDYGKLEEQAEKEEQAEAQRDAPETKGEGDDDDQPPGETVTKKGAEEEEAPDAWITDDVKETGKQLGLSDDDLLGFRDADEFNRLVSYNDRVLMGQAQQLLRNAGRQQEDSAEQESARSRAAKDRQRDESGRFAPEREQRREPPEDFSFEVDPKIKEEYGEDFANELGKMAGSLAGHFQSRLDQIVGAVQPIVQAHQMEQQRRHAEASARFDEIVDSLGNGDLFGDSKKGLSAKDKQQRQRLFDAKEILTAGLVLTGRDGTLTRALVERALRQEFASELDIKRAKDHGDRVKKADKRRLGGGGRGRKVSGQVWKGDPEKDPELLAMYKQYEEENEGTEV
jgi:hypothetical protein